MPRSPDEIGTSLTRTWACGNCGFRAHGATQPDACPECGGDRHDFRRANGG